MAAEAKRDAKIGESLTQTQVGKSADRITPQMDERAPLPGSMKGSVLWEGDIVAPAADESEWETLKEWDELK